jgi:hypothetical protein
MHGKTTLKQKAVKCAWRQFNTGVRSILHRERVEGLNRIHLIQDMDKGRAVGNAVIVSGFIK